MRSRLPALQKKVAMAVLESGDPKAAQGILLGNPSSCPTARSRLIWISWICKVRSTMSAITKPWPRSMGWLPQDELPERIPDGVLVSYQSQSYERLTDHLGDYEDDSEAHDAIYDESPSPTVEPSPMRRIAFSTTQMPLTIFSLSNTSTISATW